MAWQCIDTCIHKYCFPCAIKYLLFMHHFCKIRIITSLNNNTLNTKRQYNLLLDKANLQLAFYEF